MHAGGQTIIVTRSPARGVLRRLGRLCAASALTVAAGLPATAAAETRTTTGALPDGTAYRIDVPDPWNGILLIGLDYAAIAVVAGRTILRFLPVKVVRRAAALLFAGLAVFTLVEALRG